MTTRICDRCRNEAPLDALACPHCGTAFQSHQTTLRCKIHGATYSARVNASGEIVSGHCPLCMEKEDEEIDRLDREIESLQKDLGELQRRSRGKKLGGVQRRIWGITFFAIASAGYTLATIYSTRTFVPEIIVTASVALYMAATFWIPSLPFSPAWFTASKQRSVENQLEERRQRKKALIQRNLPI
jgi:ribosomal protein L40E